MSYSPTRIEEEDGTITQVFFECERKELRNILDEIVEEIREIDGIESASIIRRKQRNPVIKTDRNDRVYFKWDEGETRVNLAISHEPVPEVVAAFFIGENGDEVDDHLPWDREEMAEEAMRLIEERREEVSGPSDPSKRKDSASERKRRAREEGNHRDERQGEPHGGQERRGKNEFEMVGEKTAFMPAFTKEEANYHGPAQGPEPHLDCKDCVNYIEGGGCHIVQGEVDPDGYCEDLFADVAIFGRMDEGEFEVNLAMWGEMFEDRFSRVSFEVVANRVKEAIRKKL